MLVPALLAARPAGTLRTARVQMVDYTGRTESEWREALTPQEFEVLREAATMVEPTERAQGAGRAGVHSVRDAPLSHIGEV